MSARLCCSMKPKGKEKGVALAIVVWFLAGMSLLVAGIVLSARTDVRLAQIHVARAQVTAAGDGAINLLLADIVENSEVADAYALPQGRYRVGNDVVAVHGVPTEALINAATASITDLSALVRHTGAAPEGDGAGLARAVVQYRDSSTRLVRLDSIEDLFGVPGLNRAALDALRDYIIVTPVNRRRDFAATSPGPTQAVNQRLALLRSWTPALRATNPDLVAQGQLPPESGVSAQGASSYRVDALVRRDQDVWLRRRWVSLGGGQLGLPWRFQRTEPVRMVPRL